MCMDGNINYIGPEDRFIQILGIDVLKLNVHRHNSVYSLTVKRLVTFTYLAYAFWNFLRDSFRRRFLNIFLYGIREYVRHRVELEIR